MTHVENNFDATISSGSDALAVYSYRGAGTITRIEHRDVSGGLTLSYGSSGTYSGWDKFGRIAEQKWTDGAGTTVLDDFTYTHDRNSNVTGKANALHTAFSEVYAYDGLDRLIDTDRGGANLQSWNLDSLGNWRSFTDGSATQSRGANAANEVTNITGVNWAQPAYDAAGNMTAGPKSGDETTLLHLDYDAWDRLVTVKADDGSGNPGATLAVYAYDGRNYRAQRTDISGSDGTQDFYFNERWQVLEVRNDGDADPLEQYVWDGRYIDAPAVRFYDAKAEKTGQVRFH